MKKKRPILLVLKGGKPAWEAYPPKPRSRWADLAWGDHELVEEEWRRLGIRPEMIAKWRSEIAAMHRVGHLEVLDGGRAA